MADPLLREAADAMYYELNLSDGRKGESCLGAARRALGILRRELSNDAAIDRGVLRMRDDEDQWFSPEERVRRIVAAVFDREEEAVDPTSDPMEAGPDD